MTDTKTRKIDLVLGPNREVLSARCSCVSGITGDCKHTCALVIFINKERTESQTDQICEWYQKPTEWGKRNYPKGEEVESIYNLKRVTPLSFEGPTVEQQQQRRILMESLGDTSSQMYQLLTAQPVEQEPECCEELSKEVISALNQNSRPFLYGSLVNNRFSSIAGSLRDDLREFYEKEIKISSDVAYWICR